MKSDETHAAKLRLEVEHRLQYLSNSQEPLYEMGKFAAFQYASGVETYNELEANKEQLALYQKTQMANSHSQERTTKPHHKLGF